MRLWHKIFIIVLLFVTLSVEITSIFVSQSNFSGMIETEEKNATTAHTSFASGIVNRTMYERINAGEILLSQEELTDIIREISREAGTAYGEIIVVGSANELVYPTSTDVSGDILTMEVEDGVCKSLITDINGETCLITVSNVELEKLEYKLFTIRDISTTYQMHSNQMRTILFISLGLALFAAILLSGSIFVFTVVPLNKVNTGLVSIATGDYGVRLEEKGSVEFKLLARNVNRMASAVQMNVERLDTIATSRKHFVDSFAHEMKTPLTSIIGFADILRSRRNVTDQQRMDYSNIIIEEATRMKSLSGKLLEMATTDTANIDLEDVFVPELLMEVYNSTVPLVAKKHITLRIASKRVWIRADRELFKSLLYNLIDNACKASEENSELRMVCVTEGDRALISVADDGVGMAREDLIRVTEPFYMVDKSRSRRAGGAGLGLSLCSEICKRHNAQFTIDSILGEGTMVTVNIKCFVKKGGDVIDETEEISADDTESETRPESSDSAVTGGEGTTDSADNTDAEEPDEDGIADTEVHDSQETDSPDDIESAGDDKKYIGDTIALEATIKELLAGEENLND